MSDVYVDDELIFKAGAAHTGNIVGNPSTVRMCSTDWFDQRVIDTTNDYTVTVDGDSDAIEVSGGGVHGFTVATGTTDQDVCYMATALIFDITQEPEIETKIQITDVSGTSVFFGFSDAVTETTPHSTLDYAGGTLTAAANDAAGFVVDGDYISGGESHIMPASVKGAATPQEVATTAALDWADGEAKTLRVKLDTSGNAYYWVDGIQVGYIALAVADVPLCAMFNFGTRDNDNTNEVFGRYLKKWQDIP